MAQSTDPPIKNGVSAVHKKTAKSLQIAKILIVRFPDFGDTDRANIYGSPLASAIFWENNTMAKMILQTKIPTNPIYSFLCHAWKQTKEEKMELLKVIDEFYNLSKVIQSDLEQIRKSGEFNGPNLAVLFEFCGSKGKDYLFKVFGKSYSITSPLSS